MTNRYDVTYREHGVTIDPHFCRDWDESGGCYGTNPDHGFTFEEAKQHVIEYYKEKIEYWKNLKEEDNR